MQLSDAEIHANMLPISHTIENKQISLSGSISTPQHGRYDRSNIYFFVNKRWVKNYILSKALVDGYKNVLPPHQYPTGCIMITLNPSEIDVNIHPRKEEVQFLHPHTIRDAIKQSVRNTLEQHISKQLQKPATITSHDDTISTPSCSISAQSHIKHAPQTASKSKEYVPFNFDTFFTPLSEHSAPPHKQQNVPTGIPVHTQEKACEQTHRKKKDNTDQQITTHEHVYTIVGVLHKTYILVEKDDGILFVDQHAAHERILYEQFTKEHRHTTVQLLFPQTITLSAQDRQHIVPYLNIFLQSGIEIEQFSETQLVVKSIPVKLKNASIDTIIQDAIAWLSRTHDYASTELEEKLKKLIHADMACKAAVKAGDTLSTPEMHTLLNDLYTTPHRFSCPHGRPTTWHIPIDTVKKRFKRDYRRNYQSE